ncbi:MAG: hypothetical protein ABIQ59_04250 [Nocardioidaceae bacterium]
MTSIEQRLRHALTDDATTRPSVDLFARVAGSVADDRARRRSRRSYVAGAAAVLALGTVCVLTLTPRENGSLAMDWWILELFTNAVLVAIALWLGPFIKRFGRAYAADVFHDNPQTGKSYIVLTDIVYYLIFTAYILFTVNFSAGADWDARVTGNQLQVETARIGGILLIIGVLHGLNIVLMPVLGRLFSLNRSLSGHDRRD